jgi:hypothetical protein
MNRLSAIDWRRELVYPLTAAIEVAWFTPWYMSLIPETARLPAARAAAGLFVVMVIPALAARCLERLYLKPEAQRAVLLALLALTCVLSMRVLLHAGQGYSSFDWLRMTVNEAISINQLFPDWLVITSSTLFLWWRGISLAQRAPSVGAVMFSFYVGVVSFIGFVLIVSLVSEQDPSFFMPVFFFCSLMALAAARMEEMRGLRGAMRSPFGFSWLFFIALAALAVVFAGGLLGALLTGGGFKQALRWMAPLLLVFGVVFGLVLVVLRVITTWVLDLLRSLGAEQVSESLSDLLDGLDGLAMPDPAQSSGASQAVAGMANLTRSLFMLGLVIGLAVLVVWQLRRQGRLQQEDDEQEYSSVFSAALLLENLGQLAQEGRGRLAAVLGLLGRSGLRGLFAALTIRRIYAQMTRLAAEQGYPRTASETPYEYEETARRAFPSAEAEVHAITRAYVAAHYGQVPDSEAELREIRACWKRLCERREAEGE